MDDRYELLLKGGHVIDPANHIDGPMDVGIKGGQIVAVQQDIPGARADKVVKLEGLYVTPGLLDIHAHVAPLFDSFLPLDALAVRTESSV
jgi:dihydroorotase